MVSPPAEPYRTLTAPASAAAPTFSNGAPAARSAKPSLSKSPAATAKPNRSPRLDRPADLGEQLAAGAGEAAGRAVQDAAPPRRRRWRRRPPSQGADGEVGEAVVVEVSGGQRDAEQSSPGLGAAARPRECPG